jgi:betaine-aldehyde dehydrogenase
LFLIEKKTGRKKKMTAYSHDSKLAEQKLFIGGDYADATSEDSFDAVNPATNRAICAVQTAAAADIDRAIDAAHHAFLSWSQTPAMARARVLRRAVEILRTRNDELADLETLDTGKPVSETRAVDVATGADVLEYYAGLAPAVHGEYFDFPPSAFAAVRREPLGVCAGIGAWNYPLQIALWKSAPALACGNTMVFKPAEVTPLSALKLAEIYREAGLPDGAFNVVQGGGDAGRYLVRHPKIAKVSLTGEAATGKIVMADAASTLKHITLELGGKSPLIICADADLESAVSAALVANFFSNGQVCSNGTRVFVEAPVYEEFLARAAPRAQQMKIGDPFDGETQIGPLASREHLSKVLGYANDAMQSAARRIAGGEPPQMPPPLADGNFIAPAIFADCTDDMRFVKEEIFGPLMAVLRFESDDEALARANATDYGLSGAVFTANFARAHRIANGINAGNVWINDYGPTPPEVPFGGVKHSGLGRENGLQTIEHYTRLKTIYANLGKFPPYY